MLKLCEVALMQSDTEKGRLSKYQGTKVKIVQITTQDIRTVISEQIIKNHHGNFGGKNIENTHS